MLSPRNYWMFLFAAASLQAYTSLGADALGQELWSQGAAASGRGQAGLARTGEGASTLNPAGNAFDDQTLFSAKLGYEWGAQRGDGWSTSGGAFGVDAVQMSIPMGEWGSLGFVWWQRFRKDLVLETGNVDQGDFTQLTHRGGLFELVPTYALRLPGEMRFFALGFAWHVPMGRESRTFSQGLAGGTTEGLPESITLEDYTRSDWSMDADHSVYGSAGGYPSFSLHWRSRRWDYVLSYTLPHRLRRDSEHTLGSSALDTLISREFVDFIHIPALMGTAVSLRPNPRHTFSADFFARAPISNGALPVANPGYTVEPDQQTGSFFVGSLGYQREGSGLIYDTWFKRTAFRTGIWAQKWYLDDILEAGGSFGLGMPLGRRGARLDLSVRAGNRWMDVQGTGGWDEAFVGIDLGLTGVGAWGKPSRRYR